MKQMRIRHISHNDLDGYGCTILSNFLQECCPTDYIQLTQDNINPGNLEQTLKDTIEKLDQYDQVFITDLAINKIVIDLVMSSPDPKKFHIFDHHKIREDIETLPENFCVTQDSPKYPGKPTCGTELYYWFLRHDPIFAMIEASVPEGALHNMSHFVNVVRIYDTYEFWKERHSEEAKNDIAMSDAERLNTLFHVLDRSTFEDYIKSYFKGDIEWMHLTVSTEKYPWVGERINYEMDRNTRYVEAAMKRVLITPFQVKVFRDGILYDFNYKCGVVFAERNGPMIGNNVCETNPNLDFCAVVSNNQVSFYTVKPEVDVSVIARALGGGGHKDASGFTIPYQNANQFALNHFYDMIKLGGRIGPDISPEKK